MLAASPQGRWGLQRPQSLDLGKLTPAFWSEAGAPSPGPCATLLFLTAGMGSCTRAVATASCPSGFPVQLPSQPQSPRGWCWWRRGKARVPGAPPHSRAFHSIRDHQSGAEQGRQTSLEGLWCSPGWREVREGARGRSEVATSSGWDTRPCHF